jgi:hypothetical protein
MGRQHASLNDMSPEQREAMVRAMRSLSPGAKFRIAAGMTELARRLARAVLRVRHLEASDEELRCRFALWALGPELARKVYGPPPLEMAGQGSPAPPDSGP